MIGPRQEVNGVVTVCAVALLVASVFPYGAFRFNARRVGGIPAAVAFVTLTAAEEAEAMSAARTSWQTDRAKRRYERIDLFGSELPEFPHGSVEERPTVSLRHRRAHFPFKPQAFPAMRPASPPSQIPVEEQPEQTPAFSRRDLLEID